ncbi:hypothetical protein ACPRNU_23200 [Chromobacterium vaccinii]|uniref:hypothetical protein n=1 Tax=Chromobacterium vaccinii TaxID=1108595 RepID=UPI003C774A80
MDEQFYLQDSRGLIGDHLQFWGAGGAGYCTDLSKLEIYTRDKALAQHRCRETDIPWPRAYIDAQAARIAELERLNASNELLLQILKGKAQVWERDAARWGELLRHVGAYKKPPNWMHRFHLDGLEPVAGADLMRGSVAQHLVAAIDAAMAQQDQP